MMCKIGIHLRVLGGGGMMYDCLTCVDCGRDKYPEVFGRAVMVLPWPEGKMIDRSEEGRKRAWKESWTVRHSA